MSSVATTRPSRNRLRAGALEARIFAGLTVVVVAIGGFGTWSFTAGLTSAVIAPGQIAADGKSKPIQAAITGTAAAVLVREGQRVRRADLLVKLDDAQQRSTLNIVAAQLLEIEAQKARLIAERDGLERLEFPTVLLDGTPQTRSLVAEERRLFELRTRHHRLQTSRLRERVTQLHREVKALDEQSSSKGRELSLSRREADIVGDLSRRQLTTVTRPIAIDRNVARLDGEQSALAAQKARAEGQIGEVELQLASLDQSRFADAQKELRSLLARHEEMVQRRSAAEEQLARSELRAPVDGVVHQLAVRSIGAVLRPGEVAMTIVPDTGELVAEVKIRPQDIDQVYVGLPVRVRFTAFNQRVTPEAIGRLVRVGAEAVREEASGHAHYTAAVEVEEGELARIGPVKLVSGMPVEALILTGERTLASYLLKPLTDQMSRALREE